MAQRNLQSFSDDQLFMEWRQDIERIYWDTVELFSLRRTFRDIRQLYVDNERLRNTGGHVWSWLQVAWASTVLMRLRREVDGQGNTVNLKRLLHEMEERPGVLSRSRLNPPSDSRDLQELHDRAFDRHGIVKCGSDGQADHINPIVIREDRQLLEQQTQEVLGYANQLIAHRPRTPKVDPTGLTLAQVDTALQAIERYVQKYYCFMTGKSSSGMEPTAQFDTHEVFTFPWLVLRNQVQ